ncbi:MAG: HNH endonuclease [Lachnospiraceae bacterium]|nr:HNH endonuclease [Lachnospiraceae bacterium]
MGYREDWFRENKSNHGWYTCVKCGKKLRKEEVDIDHIIPQSRGGSDKLNNLQCLCRRCNRSKQDDFGLENLNDYAKNVHRNMKKDIKEKLSGKNTKKKKK